MATLGLGLGLITIAAALVLGAAPAGAQKAKDTLRIAFTDPISTILDMEDPKPETRITTGAVFDWLLCYDRKSRSFAPLLAKSWSQIDDRTIELMLRDDVAFHDGSRLTADDVVYTLSWAIDPQNKLRYSAEDLAWLERVEKIDDHRVRVIAKQPTPLALARLAISAPILPAKLHAGYESKSDFGRRTPVGTGPYKVASFDSSAGIVLVRNEDYNLASQCRAAASIGRIQALPIPDVQTQVAQLTVGGIELLHTASKDTADLLAANPLLAVTASQGMSFVYISMDAIGRSGNTALGNRKIRQALVQAIDRELVARSVLPGGEAVHAIDALCLANQLGCDFSTRPAPYDPAAAKRLLVEAGYPDGFDVEITAFTGNYAMAEALAGEFRKIGVRARVDKVTFGTYRQKEVSGKIQILSGSWSASGLPDVAATVDKYFDGGPRDYWQDPIIAKLAKEGLTTLDETKRRAIYRQLFDRVNEQSYVVPIANRPDAFVHTKDLHIEPGVINPYGAALTEMSWN
jgi:peptide/nickel transport system substrate-binding protein